jgi:hypothetical protein
MRGEKVIRIANIKPVVIMQQVVIMSEEKF